MQSSISNSSRGVSGASHAKPDQTEIVACSVWLRRERELVRPRVTVIMGASAARAVLGRVVTISRERGRGIALQGGGTGWVTVHPSFLLRLPDEDARAREYLAFVADLRGAKGLLEAGGVVPDAERNAVGGMRQDVMKES